MIPPITASLVALTLALGAVAGALGSLLGLGGGVFLVPFLVIVVGLPFNAAAAISLAAVIATSTSVSAATAGRHLINLRLGVVLEVATAAGGLSGGLLAQLVPARLLQLLFVTTIGAVALQLFTRLNRRNVLTDGLEDPGVLGGRFHDAEAGCAVVYRVKRLPVGLLASYIAGLLSTMLGIGGGIIKVPVLISWCGVPIRVAAATSAFMIGVTATSGAIIYYGQGVMVPALAGAAVVGVRLGTMSGLRLGSRWRTKWLKLMLATILMLVALLMLWRTV
jgi:uncharacterized membrane protein YfcA